MTQAYKISMGKELLEVSASLEKYWKATGAFDSCGTP